MTKEDIGSNKEKEKEKIESAALVKNVSGEAKRRPDLLAALIMTWLEEDEDFQNVKTRRKEQKEQEQEQKSKKNKDASA